MTGRAESLRKGSGSNLSERLISAHTRARATQEHEMKFRVFIEQDEDGVFVASVPALPGCISQGNSRSEAVCNTQEAIAGYLESLRAHGDPIPPSIGEEVVDVAV